MKFTYAQLVRVTSGFYKGVQGQLVSYSEYGSVTEQGDDCTVCEYGVKFNDGSGLSRSIDESELEAV